MNLNHPCPKVLLSLLGLRVRHFVLTEVTRVRAPSRRAFVCESDVDSPAGADQEGKGLFDRRPAPPMLPDVRAINAHLRAREEDILRGVAGDVFAMQALSRYLSRCVTRGWRDIDSTGTPVRYNGLPPHAALPPRLRVRVRPQQFNLVATRIRRVAMELAH